MKFRNNPYNIRYNVANNWQGQTEPSKGFCQFSELRYGVRAGLLIVMNYRNLYNLKTPREIIERWAPSIENDTVAYISFVGQLLDVDKPISSTLEYIVLMYAMWRFEQGSVVPFFDFVRIVRSAFDLSNFDFK